MYLGLFLITVILYVKEIIYIIYSTLFPLSSFPRRKLQKTPLPLHFGAIANSAAILLIVSGSIVVFMRLP